MTRRLKVKAILFDLDGTIVDSKTAYSKALKTALLKMGKHDTLNSSLATEIPKRLEQNLPITDMIRGIDVNTFLKHYLKAYYKATEEETRPVRGISEALKELSHRRFRIALITMRHVPKESVTQELARFNLIDYFECIITASDTHNPKPSPEAIVKCAKQLKVEINQCAAVGDSVADIRAGKNAGTKTVAVLSGIFSREDLKKENPDLIIESVKDLPDHLEDA
jgi:HAD superfamily hydrolase (TIGR01549 family)